jgi:hypothetical protein
LIALRRPNRSVCSEGTQPPGGIGRCRRRAQQIICDGLAKQMCGDIESS